jgi:hypothetical protein
VKETLWTPTTIHVADWRDGLLSLLLVDPGETTNVAMTRADAHRIGTALVETAKLDRIEIEQLDELPSQVFH